MLLALHRIEAVADVRSQPYSRRFPRFSRLALEPVLGEAGIHYAFLGRELGARREEKACYVGGTVCFDRVAASPAFASGLARLREGIVRYRIALLCAEKDPLDCHYKKRRGDWSVYERQFLGLMHTREIEKRVDPALLDGGCLLCSENQPHHCHRILVAEYLRQKWGAAVQIEHL